MAGFNRILLIGYVGRDPELRALPSGSNVANFSIGVSKQRKGENLTDWFNVVCFNKLADTVISYLKKGRQVHVEGEVSIRKWQDKKTNQERMAVDVIANSITFLGPKQEAHEPSVRLADADELFPIQEPARDWNDTSDIPF